MRSARFLTSLFVFAVAGLGGPPGSLHAAQPAAPAASPAPPAAPAGAAPAPARSPPTPVPTLAPARPSAPAQAPNTVQAPGPAQAKFPQAPAESPTPAAVPDIAVPAAPAPPAAAEPAAEPPADIQAALAAVARLNADMASAATAVDRSRDQDGDLARSRVEADQIRGSAGRTIEALRPKLDEIRSLIDKLGPVPGKDAAPEATTVASERARLGNLAAAIDGAIISAGLVAERASQLISRIQDRRQELFTRQIMKRTEHFPLQLGVWSRIGAELPPAGREMVIIASGWWHIAESRSTALGGLLATAVLTYFGLRWLRRRFFASRLLGDRTPPDFAERAAAAGVIGPALVIPYAAAAALLYLGLDTLDLLTGPVGSLAKVLLVASIIFVTVSALARAILQPGRPDWRVLDLTNAASYRLYLIARAVAAVYALDLILKELIRSLVLPVPVSIGEAFLASMALAVLLGLAFATRLQPRAAAAAPAEGLDAEPAATVAAVSLWRPLWLKAPLVLAALSLAVTSLTGYVALGRYLSEGVVATLSTVVLIGLLHLAIRALAQSPVADPVTGKRADWLASSLGPDGAQHTRWALAAILHIGLAVAAIPLLLVAFGTPADEAIGYVRQALFGFDIGQVHVRPARILTAIGLFTSLLLATRLVQRWLTASVLGPARVEPGIANSIRTGTGYAGFVLAALTAVSWAGFDITSLAIVAGALSVGIGFGLQSIVNNFVSGLILLVERPIKVGDWIVVKGTEGYVRQIAVRSTEIETFDKASVIIPNSDLILNAVTNWTLRNALGRLTITALVANSANPDAVKRILEKVAAENPQVLRVPAPSVVLEAMGSSGLEYALRVHIPDVNRSLLVQSDLRTAVLKGLKEAGIALASLTPDPPPGAHDPVSRANVTVKAATRSDPDAIAGALAIAAARVGELAAPAIRLTDVAGGALEFSVTGSLKAGSDPQLAESHLRAEIVKEFQAQGLAFANPQAEIYLRDLEWMRQLFTRVMEERGRERAEVRSNGAGIGEPET